MTWQARPEEDTPRMETRTFTADDGRRWAGSVMSGRFANSEQRAEIVFVCEDVPSETKRFAHIDAPPVEAADRWRDLEEDEVRALFRDSEPA
jgi:hypothetical protein